MARAAVQSGARLVVTQYGQARLSRTRKLSQQSPDVVATGISVWAASRHRSSRRGTARSTDADHVARRRIRADACRGAIWRRRAACGPANRWRDAPRGRVGGGRCAPGRSTRQRRRSPAFELAPGWLALTRDPRPLLGLPAVEVARRTAICCRAATRVSLPCRSFTTRKPPQIERGRRHYLMSTAGRTYLDMVNNVTVLGHAHPRIADTAARQLRRLNTNSRFNYAAVVEFSERLAALLPDPLDTVFLVNSGSEASDLAIRLATAATGRRDVVAVREAYHGWTYGTDAVSTSTADNPNALATRPDWVHTVESPNSFRGKYRGAEAVRYAGEAVQQIERMVRRRAARPRRSSARACTAMRVAWRCRTATCSRCMRRCGRRRAGDLRRGAGRLWPSRRMVLGFHAAECGARHRLDRQVDGQRVSARRGDHQPCRRRWVPLAGLFLLVDRRQPTVVRDRHDGPRRAARRRAAGQRRARRRHT